MLLQKNRISLCEDPDFGFWGSRTYVALLRSGVIPMRIKHEDKQSKRVGLHKYMDGEKELEGDQGCTTIDV